MEVAENRMEKPSNEIQLWKRLFQTTEMIRNYHARASRSGKNPDITLTQVQIIGCVLFGPGQQVRIRDIAEDLGITPGGVSQQVERLVQMGILERGVSEKDRRAVCITLSEKGKAMNHGLEVFFTDLFEKLLGKVSPEKRRIFMDVLDVMIETLEKEKKTKI